jgi:hypothetical protein
LQILGQKRDFLKRPLKRRILTLFLGFVGLISVQKKSRTFFFGQVPPYEQKWTNIFSQPHMTIHAPIDSPFSS